MTETNPLVPTGTALALVVLLILVLVILTGVVLQAVRYLRSR